METDLHVKELQIYLKQNYERGAMMKKSIHLITYHRAYNYGAELQAYASVLFLESLGYDVKIIDYIPKYLRGFGTFSNTFNQVDNKKKNILLRIILALIKTPSYRRLLKMFNRFIESQLPMTIKYNSYEELLNNTPRADFYCCGSDQIWNNYYTGDFDDAFYLNFLTDKDKCFSLASSFGRSNFDTEEEKYILKSLSKFSFLTVRENDGKKLLDKLELRESKLLADPTLLVDFNVWEQFASKNLIKEKYILVYQLHGDSDAYEYALKFAKNNNMKVVRIITMYHQMRIGCKNVITPNLNEFVGLIKNAEYVFTDSFHGTIFSLVFKRKLGVRLPVRFNGRILSLLENINSEEVVIKDLGIWSKVVDDKYIENAHNNLTLMRKSSIISFKESLSKIDNKEEHC